MSLITWLLLFTVGALITLAMIIALGFIIIPSWRALLHNLWNKFWTLLSPLRIRLRDSTKGMRMRCSVRIRWIRRKRNRRKGEKKKRERKIRQSGETKGWYTHWLLLTTAFLLVFLLLLSLILVLIYWRGGEGEVLNTQVKTGCLAFIGLLTYLILSIQVLHPQEIGAISVLGKPIANASSGPVFVPWIICRLYRFPSIMLQMQIPGPPELVDKSGDDKNPQEGRVKPIRVTLMAGTKEQATEDPLFARLTTEVSAVIRLQICDALQFLTQIGSLLAAARQLRDAAEAAIREEFGKMAAAEIVAHWEEVGNRIKARLDELVGDNKKTGPAWGVEIATFQVVDNDLSKTINEAIQAVTKALYKKQEDVINSLGTRDATINIAMGDARKIRFMGAAEADMVQTMARMRGRGAKEMADALGIKEGQFILMMTLFTDMMKGSQYSVLGGSSGLSDLVGLVPIFRKVLDDMNPTPATT